MPKQPIAIGNTATKVIHPKGENDPCRASEVKPANRKRYRDWQEINVDLDENRFRLCKKCGKGQAE